MDGTDGPGTASGGAVKRCDLVPLTTEEITTNIAERGWAALLLHRLEVFRLEVRQNKRMAGCVYGTHIESDPGQLCILARQTISSKQTWKWGSGASKHHGRGSRQHHVHYSFNYLVSSIITPSSPPSSPSPSPSISSSSFRSILLSYNTAAPRRKQNEPIPRMICKNADMDARSSADSQQTDVRKDMIVYRWYLEKMEKKFSDMWYKNRMVIIYRMDAVGA